MGTTGGIRASNAGSGGVSITTGDVTGIGISSSAVTRIKAQAQLSGSGVRHVNWSTSQHKPENRRRRQHTGGTDGITMVTQGADISITER